ncbi:Intraflagellar transport protein 80 [Nowakowskiella sp. JEL0407]|nr:Intraflagellar transport protein 80 [Nowakowskiella sp. JEL0407]
MAWTPDGTQIACGGGNGDRLTKASLGFGHLIVATSTQCYVYSDKNWNTPCIIDISNNGRVVCIKQCSDYFCLVDNFTGIQIYSYEARLISSPKYPGLRPELITDASISLSNDTLALKDRTDECALYFFDVQSGRQLLEAPFKHTTEILSISLNQSATTTSTRQILILDKNHDLYLTSSILSRTTTRPSHPSDKKPTSTSTSKKLASMVETAAWNDDGSDMICGMADARFVIWCYPNVLFVDEDVFPLTKFERDGGVFGKGASIVQFFGTRCTLRKADGTIVNASNFSPFPGLLQECVRKKQWEEAIRLCRFAKMKELWACLAAMAIHGQDLNTAEVAYASIDEIQKVQYICYIRDIPSAERRAAEMALLRKQPKEAEGILLSANLVYRAIRMWVGLFEWDRALEIAVKYKTHVDTVLYLREKYLTQTGRKEYLKKYVQYSQGVKVDVDAIKAKILMEEST